MESYLLITFTFLCLIFESTALMTEEKRENLLGKLTRKISQENILEPKIKSLKANYYSKTLSQLSMSYEIDDINDILEKYKFPKNFNYLEETSCPTVVKDQGRCGCCWSHAATTSLAYRYHTLGIEIDLSPQDALSCYLKDCDAGNFLIDPELNLVKNGTVTEGCLPFSSSDGRIKEKCPTECKDGSEFKKYYAQNAYMTEDYYSQDNFYDIITLMMDQIINYGPIVTGIDVYEDFMNLHNDPEKCHNEVYTYDGESEYLGGHAVVIVGYGFMDNKFYWLIQNSWGEYACDHGFVKVEFGQIGVEQISFVDPYIAKEGVIPKNINLKFNSLDGECNLKVSTSSSLNNWENSVDIEFINHERNKNFNYQCSAVKIIEEKKNICYYEYWNFWTDKGFYKYNNSNSLGVENNFILDPNFDEKGFYFYGYDEFYPILTENIYISQEGSKIVFYYYSDDMDKEDEDEYEPKIPPIYANENAAFQLSNCNYLLIEGDYFVYCDLKKEEIEDFNDMYIINDYPLSYGVLCGYKERTEIYAYKLDTTKYPIFKFKNLILPEGDTISSESVLTGIADIEGSLSGYYSKKNIFYVFVVVDIWGMNLTASMHCEIDKPRRVQKNYFFKCNLDISPGYNVPYDNLYIYPINIPDVSEYPFEIYIKETFRAQKYDPNIFIPKIQVYTESLCPDCINFITTSFKDFYYKVQNPNLAQIEFIPYGNAREVYNTSTNKYDFTCQHGEKECYGNLIETCSIQIQGRIKSYETIICLETNIEKYKLDFDNTLEYCLSNDEKTVQEIKNCVKSDMGNFYQHQMAQKTDDNHKWVPWIVVDGIHDENIENEIFESLIDYLCGDDMHKCYLN